MKAVTLIVAVVAASCPMILAAGYFEPRSPGNMAFGILGIVSSCALAVLKPVIGAEKGKDVPPR